MTVYNDGTMDVMIGGKVERRTYTIRRDIDPRVSWVEYIPDLREGEHLVTTLGSPIPTIVSDLTDEDRLRDLRSQGYTGE